MSYFCIAAGSGDNYIFVLVVLATIIAQIVKAVRKASPRTPASAGPRPADPTPDRAPAAPNDELQQFLQSLTGVAPPKPAPVPPPVAQVVAPVTPPPPPPALKVLEPVAPEPFMPPADAGGMHNHDPYKKAKASAGKPRLERDDIVKDIEHPGSLKKAIILREVLGPPLAFRY